MRIYIAGPYTAKDPRRTQLNVNRAISIWCTLRRRGYTPFLPHLTHYIWIHPEGNFSWEDWLEYDKEWLRVCDAVYRMPGESKGADIEVELAKELGKPVYYNLAELPYVQAGSYYIHDDSVMTSWTGAHE